MLHLEMLPFLSDEMLAIVPQERYHTVVEQCYVRTDVAF